MRTVNVVFEDNEHKKLTRLKGDWSWHDFIMKLAEEKTPLLRVKKIEHGAR